MKNNDFNPKKEFMFNKKGNNSKKNYSQVQNTPKNNLRINRSGRGN